MRPGLRTPLLVWRGHDCQLSEFIRITGHAPSTWICTYRLDAHVTTRLLHDDAQDHATVDARLLGDLLDRLLDERDLGVRVVQLHQALVLLPELVPAGPLGRVREVGRGPAVLDVAVALARRAGARELEDLTDLEALGVHAGVGGLELLKGDTVALCDGEESVACLDCVAHFDGLVLENWFLMRLQSC